MTTETTTTALDAYEAQMPQYLYASSMPSILKKLRRLVAEGFPDTPDRDLAESLYASMGQGDMGRGDVIRAVKAARRDAETK